MADRHATLAGRGVRLVLGTVVDVAGVTRAKAVPVDRLPVFADVGMGASPSWNVFCVDFNVDFGVAFTPALGVVGDLRPAPRSAVAHPVRLGAEPALGAHERRRPGPVAALWGLVLNVIGIRRAEVAR